MHTYRTSTIVGGSKLYTVGFHAPSEIVDDWTPMESFDKEEAARALVNYLNGGTGYWRSL